jgi:hypothetical protein
MEDLFGTSILVTDGASWKRSRLVTSRVFHINTFKVRQFTVLVPEVFFDVHLQLIIGTLEIHQTDHCGTYS